MNFLIRTLLLFCLLYFQLPAQAKDAIDSLKAVISSDVHDTDKVKSLNALAWEFKYTNMDTAFILSSEALSIAEATEWKLGIANSFNKLGSFNFLRGDNAIALEYYLKALDIYVESDNKVRITKIQSNIGNVYVKRGEFPKALEYYFKSLKKSEESGDQFNMAITLFNIGNVYKSLEDYQKALDYMFKFSEINEELGNKSFSAASFSSIGLIYNDLGDYTKALEYLFKALKIDRELERTVGTAVVLGNIGNVYNDLGDSLVLTGDSLLAKTDHYPKALKYYEEALAINEKLGKQDAIALILANIGLVYSKLDQFKKAESTLLRAIDLSRELGLRDQLRYTYEFLSKLYDATEKPAKAFEAYKLFIIYRDSISNEENTRAQTRTEMKYEYEKAELVKEQEEREAGRLEQEARRRRDNLQYSIVLICLLGIGILIAMLGRLSLSERLAEGLIFFAFLIFFEFMLVLADPYIENWSGGAPGIKLLFNAGIAALIFPLHSFFESKLKNRLTDN